MERREYDINIMVNNRWVYKVVIDPHYELKHQDSVSDKTIIELVKLMDGGTFPVQQTKGDYEYFVTDKLKLKGKLYKLIWLLENEQVYIGIVNAYRRK